MGIIFSFFRPGKFLICLASLQETEIVCVGKQLTAGAFGEGSYLALCAYREVKTIHHNLTPVVYIFNKLAIRK